MDPIYAQDDQFQTDQDVRKAYGVYSRFILMFQFICYSVIFC